MPDIIIQPMDEDHVIEGCWGGLGMELECRSDAFARFHLEMMNRYGNAAMVAVHDRHLVGFVNFCPESVNAILHAASANLCPYADCGLAPLLETIEWPDERGDTLGISCVHIALPYTRKGIGSRLVRAAVEWARDAGYKRIHAGANDTQWWIPCQPFWEKLGFRLLETKEFDEPREDGEMRVHTMELVLK